MNQRPRSGVDTQPGTAWSLADILRDWHFQVVLGAAIPIGLLWVWWIAPQAEALDVDFTSLAAFVIVFPLLEELVFRGLIQRALLKKPFGRRRFGPVTVANAVTTSLFAIAHLPRGGPLLAAGVITPGIVLGYFLERHQRLVSPIILHMSFNLVVAISFVALGRA